MTRLGALTPKEESEGKTIRGKEKGFFSRSSNWKNVDKSRLGIGQLADALSLALEEMIKEKFRLSVKFVLT